MRILDPIHKYILFSEPEARIVDSAVFQRLRCIRQLGFAEFAFPGAVHNRFLHSLGVFHIAGCMFDSLFAGQKLLPNKKKQQLRQAVRLAALLHDIGHGPLSHISEKAMPPLADLNLPFLTPPPGPAAKQGKAPHTGPRARHEHYTLKLLLESDLKKWIEDLNIDPLCIAHLIEPQTPFSDKNFFISHGVDFKPVLKQIISSDVDADRIDYLQRDSFFCGVDYGFCGHEWILNNLHMHIKNGQAFLAVGEKAVYSLESFLLGRRHMGLALYFHNKMVAMDEMLYHYWDSDDCGFHIPSSWEEYIHCTDDALFEHLKKAAVNNPWARRIIQKKPYKRGYELSSHVGQKEDHYARLKARLTKVKNYLKNLNMDFISVSSASYVNYDLPPPALLKDLPLDFQWRRGHHDHPQAGEKPPIYILNEAAKTAQPFYERMTTFNKPEYMHVVDRIYLPPEEASKMIPIINQI